jgi:hypothetical protein
MSGFRLKTHMWVSAHLQKCDIDFMPAVIIHKGDRDRGLILIKHHIIGRGCYLHKQGYAMDGSLEWRAPLGGDLLEEKRADQYIVKEYGFDEDLWVIEIEDPKGEYELPDY